MNNGKNNASSAIIGHFQCNVNENGSVINIQASVVTASVVVPPAEQVVDVESNCAVVLKHSPCDVVVAPYGILGALREQRKVGSSRNRRNPFITGSQVDRLD